MNLSFSIAAKDRHFSKLLRRVRPGLDLFVAAFAEVQLVNPIHEAILIGVTDEKSFGYFEIVPNGDGFFQVIAGLSGVLDEVGLKNELLEVIEKAILACPFSDPDKEQFARLFANWKERLLKS